MICVFKYVCMVFPFSVFIIYYEKKSAIRSTSPVERKKESNI